MKIYFLPKKGQPIDKILIQQKNLRDRSNSTKTLNDNIK